MSLRSKAAAGCLIAALSVGLAACGSDNSSSSSGGGTVDVYSSLPLAGRFEGSDRSAGQQGIERSPSTRPATRPATRRSSTRRSTTPRRRPATGTPAAVAANARKAAQDKAAVAYIGEFNSGASAISIPILNEAGVSADLAGEHVPGPHDQRAGHRAGRAGQVLPDGQAQLRAHRPARQDPGRGALTQHVQGRRLHVGRDRERQGDLRRRPRPHRRARRQGGEPEELSNTGDPEGRGELPLLRLRA